MKKLLSFLAAGALAFGLIGCSGDLHDAESPTTLYIGGGLTKSTSKVSEKVQSVRATYENGAEAYVVPVQDDGSFSLEFEYTNSIGNWGDPSTIGLLVTSVDLSKSTGWDADVNKARWSLSDGLEPNAGPSKLESGTSNIELKKVSIGGSYELKGTVNGTDISMELIQQYDSTKLYVLPSDGCKSLAADKEHIMAGSAGSYSYQFIAAADETFSVTVYNPVAGSSEKSADMTVEKDYAYTINYANKDRPTLSSKLKMLKDAEVISNAGPADYDFYPVFKLDDKGACRFEAKRDTLLFYVNRTAGDENLGWGNGETVALDGSVVLNYTARDGAEPKPVTVTGLEAGTKYSLKVSEDGKNLKVEVAVAKPSPTTIAGSVWSASEENLEWKIEGTEATATVTAKLDADYTDGWIYPARPNNKISFALLMLPNEWEDPAPWKTVELTFNAADYKDLKQTDDNPNNVITHTEALAGKTITLSFKGKYNDATGEISKISCKATVE